MRNPLSGLYEAVAAGDAVADRFLPEAVVDSPLRGRQPVADWARAEAAWLTDHRATAHAVNHIVSDRHASTEYSLALTRDDDRLDLPVHLVAELDGDQIVALRIYHSTYPLTGEHTIRPPLVPPDPDLKPAPPVGAYEAAMKTGDAEALDSLFEPDGYVREPAGSTFRHQGAARLEDFYRPAFSGGPVPLQLCTIVDDGAALAFEYVCDRWGPADLPAQAGSAVYVRSPSGLLEAVRIYDDVSPPPELFA